MVAIAHRFVTKAIGQAAIAALPRALGDRLYYAVQRRAGGLRRPQTLEQLQRAAHLVRLAAAVRPVSGARVMEVGTGRVLTTPIAFWLCGAARIDTFDLHAYLKPELVEADFREMVCLETDVASLLGPHLDRRRWETLTTIQDDFESILRTCGVRYYAPTDAGRTELPDGSIDLHISSCVFEHIPPSDLKDILREGLRVLAAGGATAHLVDLSDHFAHRDDSISPVNFLRFSERLWGFIAGNRLMYQNRMRVDEWVALLAELAPPGAEVRWDVPPADSSALAALRAGLPLAPRFAGKSPEANATLQLSFALCKPG